MSKTTPPTNPHGADKAFLDLDHFSLRSRAGIALKRRADILVFGRRLLGHVARIDERGVLTGRYARSGQARGAIRAALAIRDRDLVALADIYVQRAVAGHVLSALVAREAFNRSKKLAEEPPFRSTVKRPSPPGFGGGSDGYALTRVAGSGSELLGLGPVSSGPKGVSLHRVAVDVIDSVPFVAEFLTWTAEDPEADDVHARIRRDHDVDLSRSLWPTASDLFDRSKAGKAAANSRRRVGVRLSGSGFPF